MVSPMSTGVSTRLLRLIGAGIRTIRARLARWAKRATASPLLGAPTNLARSKRKLVAENALLPQQLLVLKRTGRRPVCPGLDRALLLLRASRGACLAAGRRPRGAGA